MATSHLLWQFYTVTVPSSSNSLGECAGWGGQLTSSSSSLAAMIFSPKLCPGYSGKWLLPFSTHYLLYIINVSVAIQEGGISHSRGAFKRVESCETCWFLSILIQEEENNIKGGFYTFLQNVWENQLHCNAFPKESIQELEMEIIW